jgi:hypothetical protein
MGHVVHLMVPFVIWSFSCKLMKIYLINLIALVEEKREKMKEKHKRT